MQWLSEINVERERERAERRKRLLEERVAATLKRAEERERAARRKRERLAKKILGTFDFDAPTTAEPSYARASDVLRVLGLPAGKGAATFAGTVLKEMVGPSVIRRCNGVFGRWYAMPPLRQQDGAKDLLA